MHDYRRPEVNPPRARSRRARPRPLSSFLLFFFFLFPPSILGRLCFLHTCKLRAIPHTKTGFTLGMLEHRVHTRTHTRRKKSLIWFNYYTLRDPSAPPNYYSPTRLLFQSHFSSARWEITFYLNEGSYYTSYATLHFSRHRQ